MGDTDMDRGAFHSIRDHQQIQKYDALNTYTIYLNSRAAPSFVDGDAALGRHYDFTNEIRDNGSGHIKNAVVRVKFIGTPFYAIAADNCYGSLNWNLSKNQYNTLKGGMSSEPLSMYNPKVVWVETYETAAAVPALTTVGGILNPLAPAGALSASGVGNTGANLSTTDVETPITSAHSAALSNVAQPTYNINAQRKTGRGIVGENFNRDWTPCQNPFGKSINISLSQINQTSDNAAIGHAAGENTCVALEVKLLPDNQANDRFSY